MSTESGLHDLGRGRGGRWKTSGGDQSSSSQRTETGLGEGAGGEVAAKKGRTGWAELARPGERGAVLTGEGKQ